MLQEVVVSFGKYSQDYSYTAPFFRNVVVGDVVKVSTNDGEKEVAVVAVYPSIRKITEAKGFKLASIKPLTVEEMFNVS